MSRILRKPAKPARTDRRRVRGPISTFGPIFTVGDRSEDPIAWAISIFGAFCKVKDRSVDPDLTGEGNSRPGWRCSKHGWRRCSRPGGRCRRYLGLGLGLSLSPLLLVCPRFVPNLLEAGIITQADAPEAFEGRALNQTPNPFGGELKSETRKSVKFSLKRDLYPPWNLPSNQTWNSFWFQTMRSKPNPKPFCVSNEEFKPNLKIFRFSWGPNQTWNPFGFQQGGLNQTRNLFGFQTEGI